LYCHPRGLPSFPTRRSSDLLVISLFISVLLSLADSHTIAKSLQAVKHHVAIFLVDHVAMIDPGQVLGVLERCLPRLLLELERLALCAGCVPRLRPTGSALHNVGGSAHVSASVQIAAMNSAGARTPKTLAETSKARLRRLAVAASAKPTTIPARSRNTTPVHARAAAMLTAQPSAATK